MGTEPRSQISHDEGTRVTHPHRDSRRDREFRDPQTIAQMTQAVQSLLGLKATGSKP
jgi:hypothetical protein